MHPSYLPGGGVEQDPAELLASVLAAGREAVGPGGGGRSTRSRWRIRARPCWPGIAPRGEPLSPAIVWQDGRSASICEELASQREQIAAKTGLTLDPYFSAPKMTWLRRNVTTEGVVTTSDTLVAAPAHRRVRHGRGDREPIAAARSGRGRVGSTSWSIYSAWPSAICRALLSCDEVIGTTIAFGAVPIPVGGLIVDQQAALLAQACLVPGEAKCTFGTGAFLLANTGVGRAPLGRRAHHLGRLAAARAIDLLRGRAGLHGRVRGALADRPRPDRGRRRPRLGRRHGRPRRPGAVRAGASRGSRHPGGGPTPGPPSPG